MEKTIVIIDGDEETGKRISSLHLRATIHQLFTGKEAMEYFAKHTAHIVLLELQLSDMSGLDLLRQLPTVCLSSNIIIFTQYASVETTVKAMKLGAKDLVMKSVCTKKLYALLKHYLCDPVTYEYEEPLSLEELERRHIRAVLCKNNGNRKKTAEDLDISLRTLYYKIKQYNLE